MVGTETADDAAVYKLNDEQALIATTDFFMPIVDDPYDFGRIAATNALSDVMPWAARPSWLAIVGMPINVLPHSVIADILRGGESVCAEAGIPAATASIRSSPSMVWRQWGWCIPVASSAMPMRAPATC